MCLALLSIDAHPRYALVIAANRDEYHARATASAAWWPEGFVAGRDLEAGGTWLGVTRAGRFALLTNFRDPKRRLDGSPSRGALVPRVLADSSDAIDALSTLRRDAERYNGFNIIVGTPDGAAWTSNRAYDVQTLPRGVYGLSNALIDSPWPKLSRTKAGLVRWVTRGDDDIDVLFDLLADRDLAPDDELPSTGVALEWERRLSAPFIVSDTYGTRSSTIVTIGRDGNARFVERSFDARGQRSGEVDVRFRVERSA